jgi:hypothetical protein
MTAINGSARNKRRVKLEPPAMTRTAMNPINAPDQRSSRMGPRREASQLRHGTRIANAFPAAAATVRPSKSQTCLGLACSESPVTTTRIAIHPIQEPRRRAVRRNSSSAVDERTNEVNDRTDARNPEPPRRKHNDNIRALA